MRSSIFSPVEACIDPEYLDSLELSWLHCLLEGIDWWMAVPSGWVEIQAALEDYAAAGTDLLYLHDLVCGFIAHRELSYDAECTCTWAWSKVQRRLREAWAW